MTTQLLHDECELTMDAASSPLPREAFWVLDWISLRASAVYRGEGVPRGRGEAVIVVPGFSALTLTGPFVVSTESLDN